MSNAYPPIPNSNLYQKEVFESRYNTQYSNYYIPVTKTSTPRLQFNYIAPKFFNN